VYQNMIIDADTPLYLGSAPSDMLHLNFLIFFNY